MESKILSVFLLTVFILLTTSLIIAANFSVNPISLKFREPIKELSFVLTPPTNVVSSYELTFPVINQDNSKKIEFTSIGTLTNINTAQTININTNVDYDSISIGKTYSGNIVVKNIINASDTLSIPVSFTGTFCKNGEQGKLAITDVKIDNSDGDDDEWSPLDKIEVEVEVSNNDNVKIKDVMVQLGLFDADGKNMIDDMDDLDDEEIDLGSIKDDDEETAIFKFKIPADFEDGNYRLVVKAFSDDVGEDKLCTSKSSDLDNEFFHVISGEREEDEKKHIIIDNINISPSPAQCNEKVQVSARAVNIGDESYEDQIKVTLISQDLNLNLEKIVREDFDQGDSELVEFEFDAPEQIEEKSYLLEFRTYYDYDKDDDSYDIVSEDKFSSSLKVAGNCKKEVKSAQITAQLDQETPEAVAGKQVIINAKLKNTGDVGTTHTVSVLGNTDWSSLVSLEPQTVKLAPGESANVNIVLDINNDAKGDNEFTIKSMYDNQVTEQRVVLTILPSKTQADLTPFVEHVRANWFIYLIVLVNIILIIAIILVIRSMVSPRAI